MHEGLDRADIDDAPLVAGSDPRNACVTLNTPVRLIAIISSQSLITASRCAGHAVAPRDAGVVDQDGDRADGVGDPFCHRGAGRAVGDIERKTVGGAAGVADQFCGFFCAFRVDIERDHPCALAGIADCDRAADAGACAGDDRDLVLKEGHGVVSSAYF